MSCGLGQVRAVGSVRRAASSMVSPCSGIGYRQCAHQWQLFGVPIGLTEILARSRSCNSIARSITLMVCVALEATVCWSWKARQGSIVAHQDYGQHWSDHDAQGGISDGPVSVTVVGALGFVLEGQLKALFGHRNLVQYRDLSVQPQSR